MAYPRLIMGLYKNKGVMIPDESLELNIGLVDDEYDEIQYKGKRSVTTRFFSLELF